MSPFNMSVNAIVQGYGPFYCIFQSFPQDSSTSKPDSTLLKFHIHITENYSHGIDLYLFVHYLKFKKATEKMGHKHSILS